MFKKMNMIISNGNPSQQQIFINNANVTATANALKKNIPSSLNAPMILRVHNVRGGCGSCGK
jgi:hypothetical protein